MPPGRDYCFVGPWSQWVTDQRWSSLSCVSDLTHLSCSPASSVPCSRGWMLGAWQSHSVGSLSLKIDSEKRRRSVSEGRSLSNTRFSYPQSATLWKQANWSHAKATGRPCTWPNRRLAGRAICSNFRQGHGVAGQRECPLESGTVPGDLCTFPLQSGCFLQTPYVWLFSSSRLLDLLEKNGRKVYIWSFFSFSLFFPLFPRKVKRIGKTQQRNQRRREGGKKQDPKIEALFQPCPTPFFLLLCDMTFFFCNLLKILEKSQLFGCEKHSN